jgi:hypothetical protein
LQTIDQENEQRKRLEQAVALAALKKENQVEEVVLRNKANQKKQQVMSQKRKQLCKLNEN